MPSPGLRTVVVGVLLSTGGLAAARQSPADPQAPPRFRVGVDIVRLDAVVTDPEGRVVRDLRRDEFEVYQDGRQQAVVSTDFFAVDARPATPSARPAAADGSGSPSFPARIAAAPRASDVQRTVAIVVDDLGMSFRSLHDARRGLHTFVDREIGPHDLAAVIRTGGSIGLVQSFSSDVRVLHAAIDAIRWNGFTRTGLDPFKPVTDVLSDEHTDMTAGSFAAVEQLRGAMSAVGTLGALNLAVRGAGELPGRKAIVFVSEGFEFADPGRGSQDRAIENLGGTRVRVAVDRVIDRATRAGVVIYSLDPRGLQTAGLTAADGFTKPRRDVDAEALIRGESEGRRRFNLETQQSLTYLAEQTGGFAVLNNNDLSKGLARIADDVRDYYVIGYAPEEGTFAAPGRTPRLHRIEVKVTRPGLRVKTRKQFIGVSDPDVVPSTPEQQLVKAAISPFAVSDIAVRATTLPGYEPDRGPYVRALLHIDARALSFVEGADGKRTTEVDVLGMAFDLEGNQVAHLSTGFAAALTPEATQAALRDGVAYSLRVPIRAAGGYQVRFAVRDRASGRVGTAGEFVDVPDAAHGAFALSGIVLREAGTGEPGARLALTAGQAQRAYPRGTQLAYAFEIYNPGREVQTTLSLWRGDQRIFEAPPDRLTPSEPGQVMMAAGGSFRLGAGLAPGSYILQILATTPDPKGKAGSRLALQRLDFEVE